MNLQLETYVEAERCGVQRRDSDASCELPSGHTASHVGRDKAGHWHGWKESK